MAYAYNCVNVVMCYVGNVPLTLLRDLKHRGLTFPRLTVADGHLGIWAAFGELHPTGTAQRCWNHKIANVLNDRPKTVQR